MRNRLIGVSRGTPESAEACHRVARWARLSLSPAQDLLLERYHDWLRDEALPAGGIGRAEAGRLWRRHIADSLVFAGCWPMPPSRLLDLGSGAGLPGIPLAIAWPGTVVRLLDRSHRRVLLARRACRVLDLDNVELIEADAASIEPGQSAVVSRATLPPAAFFAVAARILAPNGLAVTALSHQRPVSSRQEPLERGISILEVPVEVLDAAVALLMMRRE